MGKKKHSKKKPGQRIARQKEAGAAGVSAAPRGGGQQPRGVAAAAGPREQLSIWPSLLAGSLIFLIASPAIVGPYGQGVGYMPDVHMSAYIQVGAMVLFSLFLVSTFIRKRMQIIVPRSPLLLPLLCFYGWAMLSVLWADTKYEAVNDALDWTGAFLCGLLAVLLLRDMKWLKTLFFFLTISGLLMALLAIGQFLFGIDWVHQHIVPAATFSNKNMAGQYGVLIFPLALMLFLGAKDPLKIWFFAVTTALIMVYVFYTRSRGAMAGLLVEIIVLTGLLVYVKLRHGHHFLGDIPVKKVALAASLALFVGVSSLTPSMFGNVEKVMSASLGVQPPSLEAKHGGELLKRAIGYETTAATRLAMWGNSIPMFKDNFLWGVGLGNWTVHYATYQARVEPDLNLMDNQYHTNAHNDYLEILCELGVIGFALFIWVIVSFFRVAGRLLFSRNEEYFLPALALVASVVGIGSISLVSFPLKQPVPILLIFVYMAVLSNLHGILLDTGKDYVFSLPPVPVRGAVTVVSVLAALSLFGLQRNWHLSESHYHNAIISLESGDYRNALAEAERSYEFNPLRKNLLWLQATNLLQLGRKESYQEAIGMLQEVKRAYPYSSNTMLNLSASYGAVGKVKEAAGLIDQLVSLQPINMPLKNKNVPSLVGTGKLEEAIKTLEIYSRNWQYSHERTVKRMEVGNPEALRLGLNPWEQRQRSRVAQIARDIEKVKRSIRQRDASAGNAAALEHGG